jgi:quinolinate synthase
MQESGGHARDLPFTPAVEQATRPIYERLRNVIPAVEWPGHAPVIAAINELKKQRNAVILAHNYQSPEIFHGVADYTGDSLGLAQFGAKTDADVIVLCGVHFMAESAKILSPEKTVLIPDLEAGCSLASSITAADVRALKQRYPGVPVVTYVNTSAAVKAESDICCTSANAVKVVESLGVPRVIFIPDKFLGRYVAGRTPVEVILWEGACEVHERFTGPELREFRQMHPGIHVMAHPECPPDVLAEADYVGSTTAMIVEFPQVKFTQPCNLCPHMKRISLPKILRCLQDMAPDVTVPADQIAGARRALDRMLAIGRRD